MVKIPCSFQLDILRSNYSEKHEYQSLTVLEKLIDIASLNDNSSLPASFDIMSTFCDYDIIKDVLLDIGIPSIYIRSVYRIREGFHVQLYNLCD